MKGIYIMNDEKKLQFEINEEGLNRAFKEAAKEMGDWKNDPNRKEYKPEEMIIDVGDHYFLTDQSDVEAYKQGNFPKLKSKYRRNYVKHEE
jgi:hypothetical protein